MSVLKMEEYCTRQTDDIGGPQRARGGGSPYITAAAAAA